ncbi:MAG TPA: alpha/beta hydrolase-fold protein [Actinophytocola sp.]|uniref:alpha/beta hydrolase n=1 Tax=Actinophytocola sp. TaxID=1872138 RepID=UPI002E04AEAD|nr:alpha/beta hydrolase-fold protein [Actinophytocola sp.]
MSQPPQSLAAPTGVPNEPVTTERVHSPARGTSVELITMRPAGVAGRMQICLALHGKGAGARMFLDLGVPDMLNNLVAQGVPPFAVVAVDGGDNYWVARNADDPQKMLTVDVPTWMANRGFETLPFAALGISMGGYGALNYARNPGLSAVAAVSAALFNSWPDARGRNAFADQAQWEATEPLRHTDDIRTVPLGVWCGTSDSFVAQARQLVTKARPRISAIGAGGHDAAYWRKVLPEVLRFVGETLP